MSHDLQWRPSAQEINVLPRRIFSGSIHVIRSPRQWRQALPDILSETVLGFDTETKPNFSRGKANLPSLIQLSTDVAVYLVQLNWFPFGKECAEILANANIVKTGVAIGDDMSSLAKLFPFKPARLVDLGEMAKRNHLPNHGLRTLAASLFGWRIAKGAQCSNWNSRNLTDSQIIYAATDAWISRKIYFRLKELGFDDPEQAP